MIDITNPKLAGLEPRWAPFRGVSLVFDNPPDASFLRALRDALSPLSHDPLVETHALRLLPPSSLHVTAWDGVNDGNLPHVAPEHRAAWTQFLDSLPPPPTPTPLLREILDSELLACPDWHLHLACAQIENWSDVSLVARLAPANPASADALRRLQAARDSLSESFGRTYGVRPHPSYVPHITLGYFANAPLAAASAPAVARWNAALLEKTAGLSLPLRRMRLSAFADMTSFGATPP